MKSGAPCNKTVSAVCLPDRSTSSSSVSRPHSSTYADKLNSLLDNEWIATKSTIRSRHDNSRTYDVTYSYDARSDNPIPYSKMEVNCMPNQPARPICVSGNAVIMLEKQAGLEVFNIKQNEATAMVVPLNPEQKNLDMSRDYRGHIPIFEDAKNLGKSVIMAEPESFQKYHIKAPVFEIVSKPECFEKAGSNCDQKLLNPHERIIIQEYEKRTKSAGLMIGEAQNARQKLKQQLAGIRFQRGVTGVDCYDNVNSEIYGEKATAIASSEKYRTNLDIERRISLSKKTSSIITNGNILVPENMDTRVQVQKFYQGKGGEFHNLTFQNTFNRLFCRTDAKQSMDHRTQALRERDLNGRTYDLVTHAGIEHWPVSGITKAQGPEHKVLAHPSQASLEHSRNLQGAIQRSNFII